MVPNQQNRAPRWKPTDKPSASRLNLVLDLAEACGPLSVDGAADSVQGVRGRGISVPRPKKRPNCFWMVWDQGPNGEADFTDHRYWLILALAVPGDTTDGRDLPKLYQTINKYIICATNMSERPAGTDGDNTAGTHNLPKGTVILSVQKRQDDGDPGSPVRYVFQSGGAGAASNLPDAGEQYTVMQSVADQVWGVDWVRLHG